MKPSSAFVETSECQGGKANGPEAVGVFLERDIFAGERGAEEECVTMPRHAAVARDTADLPMTGIVECGQGRRQGATRRRVAARGRPVAQRFMWPHLVVVPDEAREPTLLRRR